uniref:BTB domain-containing protein n=1 Tax=Panagrellus redivivus TaxID=6233 RepID=A0A7E4VIB0_PANRE
MSVEASKFSNYIEFERIICLPPAFVNSTEPTLNASLRPIIAHHRHNWYFWSCMAYVNIYNGVKLVTFFLKFLGLRYRYCAHPEHAIGTEDLNTRLISDLNQPRIMVNEKSYRFKRIAEHLHPPIFGTQSIKGLQDLCTDNGVKVSLRLGIPREYFFVSIEQCKPRMKVCHTFPFNVEEMLTKCLACEKPSNDTCIIVNFGQSQGYYVHRMILSGVSRELTKLFISGISILEQLIVFDESDNRLTFTTLKQEDAEFFLTESIRHTRAVLENDTFKDYQYSLEHHFIAASKLRSLVRRQIKRYI